MIDKPGNAPPLVLNLAKRIASETGFHDVLRRSGTDQRITVPWLRRRLNISPRDPVGWVDLAREYTILGKFRRAERAIVVALQMAPANRFVLRSAVRFFVHRGEPDRALSILRKAPSISGDPWLLGPEVSVVFMAGKSPQLTKVGRRALGSQNFSNLEVSELAASLATLEFRAGSTRVARRLFRQAIREPTENMIAQLRWASDHHIGLDVATTLLDVPRTFEAAARVVFVSGGDRASSSRRTHRSEPTSDYFLGPRVSGKTTQSPQEDRHGCS